jgi:hypothetical protein
VNIVIWFVADDDEVLTGLAQKPVLYRGQLCISEILLRGIAYRFPLVR